MAAGQRGSPYDKASLAGKGGWGVVKKTNMATSNRTAIAPAVCR